MFFLSFFQRVFRKKSFIVCGFIILTLSKTAVKHQFSTRLFFMLLAPGCYALFKGMEFFRRDRAIVRYLYYVVEALQVEQNSGRYSSIQCISIIVN